MRTAYKIQETEFIEKSQKQIEKVPQCPKNGQKQNRLISKLNLLLTSWPQGHISINCLIGQNSSMVYFKRLGKLQWNLNNLLKPGYNKIQLQMSPTQREIGGKKSRCIHLP